MTSRDHRTGSARGDWNQRARDDYRHAIDSATAGDTGEEAFRRSGEEDVADLLAILEGRDLRSWRALDYGCGVGRLMVAMSRHVEWIDGIDVSDEMIRIGRERNRALPRVAFHVLETQMLPFEDASFDLVYSILVFQHMPRKTLAAMVPEVARVLRPGGLLAFQLTAPYTLGRKIRAWTQSDHSARSSGLLRRRGGAPDTYRRRYYRRATVERLLARSGLRLSATRRGANPRHVYHLGQRETGLHS